MTEEISPRELELNDSDRYLNHGKLSRTVLFSLFIDMVPWD